MLKKGINIFITTGLILFFAALIFSIASCSKSPATAAGLNVEYEILNLSPDLLPVDLYIDFKQVNSSPLIYGANNGYFYLPSLDTPYQVRSHRFNGITLFSRYDILKAADSLKYTLFLTGTLANNTITQIFTIDTSKSPALGRGKIRFVNASPTATSGLDLYANGTQAFTGLVYPKVSGFIELPVGNYDIQIDGTGTSSVLKDLPGVTIQDGRLYTIYAYGYTTRIDTAAFNAGIITNK